MSLLTQNESAPEGAYEDPYRREKMRRHQEEAEGASKLASANKVGDSVASKEVKITNQEELARNIAVQTGVQMRMALDANLQMQMRQSEQHQQGLLSALGEIAIKAGGEAVIPAIAKYFGKKEGAASGSSGIDFTKAFPSSDGSETTQKKPGIFSRVSNFVGGLFRSKDESKAATQQASTPDGPIAETPTTPEVPVVKPFNNDLNQSKASYNAYASQEGYTGSKADGLNQKIRSSFEQPAGINGLDTKPVDKQLIEQKQEQIASKVELPTTSKGAVESESVKQARSTLGLQEKESLDLPKIEGVAQDKIRDLKGRTGDFSSDPEGMTKKIREVVDALEVLTKAIKEGAKGVEEGTTKEGAISKKQTTSTEVEPVDEKITEQKQEQIISKTTSEEAVKPSGKSAGALSEEAETSTEPEQKPSAIKKMFSSIKGALLGNETVTEHEGLEGAKVVEGGEGIIPGLLKSGGSTAKGGALLGGLSGAATALAGGGGVSGAAAGGLGGAAVGAASGAAGAGAAITAGLGAATGGLALLAGPAIEKAVDTASDITSAPTRMAGAAIGKGLDIGTSVVSGLGSGNNNGNFLQNAAASTPSGKDLPGAGVLGVATLGASDKMFESFDKVKEKAGALADSFVGLVKDGINPATNYVEKWTQAFEGTVSKFNPAIVERYHLALDNLSAAAGKMFQPIIEAATGFADELNALYTSIQGPIQSIFGDLSKEAVDFGREFFTGLQGIVSSVVGAIEPLVKGLAGVGGDIGAVFRDIFKGVADVIDNYVKPIFEAIGGAGEPLRGIFADVVDIGKSLWAVFQAIRGAAADFVLIPFRSIGSLIDDTGGIFLGLVRLIEVVTFSLSVLAAGITGIAAVIREAMGRIAHPVDTLAGRRESFSSVAYRAVNESLSSRMGAGAQRSAPTGGAMTYAAQPARQVGIEDIGQQARAAAFSQASSVGERTANATESLVALTTDIQRRLEAMGMNSATAAVAARAHAAATST